MAVFLGAAMGDIAAVPVEAKSSQYISRTYRSVDEILSVETVPEFVGSPWRVGRFTDDTQMMICVAEWLLEGPPNQPEKLLARFSDAYEPARRYGPGTEAILRAYPQHKLEWRELSTMAFPHGSHGNGVADESGSGRAGLLGNLKKAASVAIESSRPTHSHPLAYQGAVLQAIAVATAANTIDPDPAAFLTPLRDNLQWFADLQWDTSKFAALGHDRRRPLAGSFVQ